MSKPSSRRPPLVAETRTKPSTKRVSAKPKAKRQTAPPKSTLKRRALGLVLVPIRFVLRMVLGLAWRVGALVALIVGVGVSYTYIQLPPLSELIDGRSRGSVTMLDRNEVIFAWRGDQFGGAISAASVAPALRNAVVATEDKRFYRHLGVSPRGIASAMRINWREGRKPWQGNGGSTITQQTAKLLCLGVKFDHLRWKSETEYERDCRRTTLARKAKEALYALALEAKYSKDDILSIYLNRAYLGAGARGFEAASQRYFSKHAALISIPESAMLAGLLKAPSIYAPTNGLERSRARAATILRLMREQGYISAVDEAVAIAEPASLSAAAQARAGGYFVDWVMDSAPPFLARDTTEDVEIHTTFDYKLQTAAEEALSFVFDDRVRDGSKAEAAIIVMSPDGAVRAMVGGRNKIAGAFNRATSAKRQTGSAFKPFVYAAAMDFGFQYDSIVDDAPVCINTPGSGEWCPQNYTREFGGPLTLTDALRLSVNTVAVKVSEEVGRDKVRDIATQFGIDNALAVGPALALGASESTLLEMSGAYAGILNGGRAVTPYGLVEIRLKGETTPLMGKNGGYGERVISPQAAEQLVYMMHRVITDGTGARARLADRESAGKTGTTQEARDAWFIGFTEQYLVGVWMGYDDNTPLNGVTGGGLPALIWRETMERVSQDLPAQPLRMIRPAEPPVAFSDPDSQSVRQPPLGQRKSTEEVITDLLGKLLGN